MGVLPSPWLTADTARSTRESSRIGLGGGHAEDLAILASHRCADTDGVNRRAILCSALSGSAGVAAVR